MPPRLRDVAALPELGLLVRVAPAGALEREVRWVAVSELEDPAPWMEGGELLLTTGLRLSGDRRACDRYVRGLVKADVAALGFAVGLTHDDVPGALVRAAERAGLPLLEVPRPTPFVAVSKAVSRLVAAEEYDEAARGFAAQRELIRAALTGDDAGAAAVVARLAAYVGGVAVQTDPAGRVLHAAPPSAAAILPELEMEIARLRPRGLLASAVVASADRHVVIQPLGVQGRARGFLVVASPEPPRPAVQAVVNLAVSLLSLGLARTGVRSGPERGLRALAVRLLLQGRATPLPLAALGWSALSTGPVSVLLAQAPEGRSDSLEDSVAELAPGSAVAAGALDGQPEVVVAVLPAGEALAAAAALPSVAGIDDLAVGVSGAVGSASTTALAPAVAQAARALAVAREAPDTAPRVRAYEDLRVTGLESLLDPEAVRAWSSALVEPLGDPAERADLVATLRAWLTRHGQVDAAAGDLGVHRHTVRHRLRRAEALLGRSLDDPGVRAELWVALSHLDTMG